MISCVFCPPKESFRDIFVLHCPGPKKLEHNLEAFGENCKFVWGGNPGSPKMPGIKTAVRKSVA